MDKIGCQEKVWSDKDTGDIDMDYVLRVFDILWWYYAVAAIIAVVVGRKWRWEGGLLAGYAFLILVGTVLIRKPFTGEHLKLELLWSWKAWSVQKNQILTNMLMFVPVGALVGRLWKWKGLAVAVGVSLAIELLQLITVRGLCEFDDVLHNMIGAVIGIGIVMATRKR